GGGGGTDGEFGSWATPGGDYSACAGQPGTQSSGGGTGSCLGFVNEAGGKNFGGDGLAFPSPGNSGGGGGDGYYGGSSGILHAGGGGGSGYLHPTDVTSGSLQTATDSTTPPNTGDVDYPGSIGTTGAAAAGGAGHVVVLF
ncbi:MAG: hypothetical protein GY898_02040, partial [Proteobacteria bacterium]|nr:hypothetical protein [Pseudomonadota bacterium]